MSSLALSITAISLFVIEGALGKGRGGGGGGSAGSSTCYDNYGYPVSCPDKGPDVGLIVGLVVGGVVLACCVIFCCQKAKQKEKSAAAGSGLKPSSTKPPTYGSKSGPPPSKAAPSMKDTYSLARVLQNPTKPPVYASNSATPPKQSLPKQSPTLKETYSMARVMRTPSEPQNPAATPVYREQSSTTNAQDAGNLIFFFRVPSTYQNPGPYSSGPTPGRYAPATGASPV